MFILNNIVRRKQLFRNLIFYNQPPFRGDLPFAHRGDLGLTSTSFSLSSGVFNIPKFILLGLAHFIRDLVVGRDNMESVVALA